MKGIDNFAAGAGHCVQAAGKNVHPTVSLDWTSNAFQWSELSFETGKNNDHLAVSRGH